VENLTLVIIEDEKPHFDLMKRAISREFSSASVHHFWDAITCLEKLDQIKPTVIITDYLMPGMTGIAFLEALNKQDTDIPVVMTTGQGDEDIAVHAIKSGAKDYLVKSKNFFNLLPSIIKKVVLEQRLEKALKQSETQKQAILDASLDEILYIDMDMKIIWANKTVSLNLNAPFKDIIGQFCYRALRGRKTPCLNCPLIKARDSGCLEQSIVHDSELNEKYFNSYSVPIFSEKKEINGFINISKDITKQKAAEDALKQSEKRFRNILDNAPFGYYRIGKDGLWEYINHEWARMYGYSGREIIGKSFELDGFAKNMAQERENFRRSLSGEMLKGELERCLKNGSRGYHDYYIKPVYQNGKIVAVEGFINDTTERKQAEKLVGVLSQSLLQSQENERRMISYELHDGVAQELSASKIQCDMLLMHQPGLQPHVKEKLQIISNSIQETIGSVRSLSYELRPPVLEDMGIVEAIKIYCEEFFTKNKIKIDFQSAGLHLFVLDPNIKIHLYRLIQESLNNIRKHADATHVNIMLMGASPNIILSIEDNGKGFDVKVQKGDLSLDNGKRMGLQNMKQRINLFHGQMVIQSRPMRGTKILIKIPVIKRKE